MVYPVVGRYCRVTAENQLVGEMVPDKFGWFRFVFSKQNRETFQTFTGSIRGKDLDQRANWMYAVSELRGARAVAERGHFLT